VFGLLSVSQTPPCDSSDADRSPHVGHTEIARNSGYGMWPQVVSRAQLTALQITERKEAKRKAGKPSSM
jgi:hypothetical protein